MTENKKQKVVVTGGAGFIGSHLTDALVEKGYEVHVVDDLSDGKKEHVNEKAIFHLADIRDTEKVKEICTDALCVFHLAALPRVPRSIDYPQKTHDININGTLSVLIGARDAGVKKLIYSSSSSAYGSQKEMPLHEGLPANPESPYAVQKHVGELYAKVFNKVYGMPTVCLRYFSVYGPRFSANDSNYSLVVGKFLLLKKEGKPLTVTGDGTQTRDFTFVSDVVKANILALESDRVGQGEIINIGSGNNITVNEIAEIIGGPIEYIPARPEPKDTLASNKKAKELLGWEPEVGIKEGIDILKKDIGLE